MSETKATVSAREFTAKPNADGTVTIVHFGTTFRHVWVAEFKKRRNGTTVEIYGKKGGRAMLLLETADITLLKDAQHAAQEIAVIEDEEAGIAK